MVDSRGGNSSVYRVVLWSMDYTEVGTVGDTGNDTRVSPCVVFGVVQGDGTRGGTKGFSMISTRGGTRGGKWQ